MHMLADLLLVGLSALRKWREKIRMSGIRLEMAMLNIIPKNGCASLIVYMYVICSISTNNFFFIKANYHLSFSYCNPIVSLILN